MARKTKKKQRVKPARAKKKSAGPSALRRWVAAVGADTWRRLLRVGIALVLIGGITVGVAVGLEVLRVGLRAGQRQMVSPDAVQIADKPAPPVPPAVHTRLQQDTGQGEQFDLCEPGLLKQLAGHYAAQPWVRRVVRVQRVFPDRVIVRLEYRRPLAFVAQGRHQYYWVDEDGVRLPGVYSRDEVYGRVRQMVIGGVAEPPPEPGRPWVGADLAAGLRLVRRLGRHVARNQLDAISVANYGGRINPGESHLILLTPDNTHVLWGNAPGEEGPYEASFELKLANLAWFYNNADDKQPGLQGQFRTIQLDLPEKVYYTLRSGAPAELRRG
jgi:hypothetical protein